MVLFAKDEYQKAIVAFKSAAEKANELRQTEATRVDVDVNAGQAADNKDSPQEFLLGPCMPAQALYATAVNSLAIATLHADNVADAVS
jgi:hypothetical protein